MCLCILSLSLTVAGGPVLDFGVPLIDPMSPHHLLASGGAPQDHLCYPSARAGPSQEHMAARFGHQSMPARSMPGCAGVHASKMPSFLPMPGELVVSS